MIVGANKKTYPVGVFFPWKVEGRLLWQGCYWLSLHVLQGSKALSLRNISPPFDFPRVLTSEDVPQMSTSASAGYLHEAVELFARPDGI